MSKISESGYFFIHSGILEKEQIEESFNCCVRALASEIDKSFEDTKFEINVVKNREGEKFGHSYAWVNNKYFFNALLGKNFDGSERFEWVEDEDWVPPEGNMYDELAEIDDFDWLAADDIERKYQRPKKKVILEPIITLPAVEYTEEQFKEIEGKSQYGFMEIFEAKISRKTGKLNTLFSNDIPNWIDEKILMDYFKKFEKDDVTHFDKKSKKKFQYPIIKIKSKKELRETRNFCTITFSTMNPNTASFLINVAKRVEFEKDGKKCLLFFSQSKDRGSD